MEIKKQIKQIFEEIDEAIKKTKSNVPVKIEDSEFIKELEKIKEKYSRQNKNTKEISG